VETPHEERRTKEQDDENENRNDRELLAALTKATTEQTCADWEQEDVEQKQNLVNWFHLLCLTLRMTLKWSRQRRVHL
jgi:hypothetical protein